MRLVNSEIKLDVPLICQSPDTIECGLAALAMIYSYYDIPVSLTKLREEVPLSEVGVYAPQLGTNLIEHGFNAEIITYNPRLIEKIDQTLDQKALLYKFKYKADFLKTEGDKKCINYFINFMEQGGTIRVTIPSLEVIQEQLENKQPLIASLATIIYPGKPDEFHPYRDTIHGVVITGRGQGLISVNDPSWTEDGGKHSYPELEFLYAVHASALGDLDNACFITANKSQHML